MDTRIEWSGTALTSAQWHRYERALRRSQAAWAVSDVEWWERRPSLDRITVGGREFIVREGTVRRAPEW